LKSPITYYMDAKLEKRLAVNETGEPIIDWGETIPGKHKEMTLYVQNHTRDNLALRQPYSTSPDLKIEDFPVQLKSNDVGTVKLSFKLNEETIKSHRASWGFQIIVG